MHSDHMLDRVLTIEGVGLSSVKDWNTASDHKVYKQIEVSILYRDIGNEIRSTLHGLADRETLQNSPHRADDYGIVAVILFCEVCVATIVVDDV